MSTLPVLWSFSLPLCALGPYVLAVSLVPQYLYIAALRLEQASLGTTGA